MARNTVSSDDLFTVCAHQYGYAESVARVLSNLLFWSQFAQNYFRGHIGIYKTDGELARELHKHPKTVGRLLREVSAPAEKDKPRAVFHTRYGPKPGAPGGRVRWLFRTELGDQIIEAAKARAEARLSQKSRRQNAATGRREMQGSATPKRFDRSPQYAATHIRQNHFSNSRTDTLSSAEAERETPNSYEEKESREGIERLVRCWKTVCEECNRPELAWRTSEVRRWSAGLGKFIHERGVADMSDENSYGSAPGPCQRLRLY